MIGANACDGMNDSIPKGEAKHLLIMMNGVNYVDLDGAEWLAQEAIWWKKRGGGLYFIRLKIIAQDIMTAGGYMEEIGRENFFNSKTDAIAEIYKRLDRGVCRACQHRVFLECERDADLPKLNLIRPTALQA